MTAHVGTAEAGGIGADEKQADLGDILALGAQQAERVWAAEIPIVHDRLGSRGRAVPREAPTERGTAAVEGATDEERTPATECSTRCPYHVLHPVMEKHTITVALLSVFAWSKVRAVCSGEQKTERVVLCYAS